MTLGKKVAAAENFVRRAEKTLRRYCVLSQPRHYIATTVQPYSPGRREVCFRERAPTITGDSDDSSA
jgi:hypothetical protein